MKSYRVTFRCNPYKAQSHFLWINAPDNVTEKEVMRAAYDYKDGLPVDVIDDITKWVWVVDKPHLSLLNSEQNGAVSDTTEAESNSSAGNQTTS